MKKLIILGLWALLALSMLKFQSAVASPGTIEVPGDYGTIQWAIGNATAGDTIRVHAGTYYEHIVVDKQLSLIGDGIRATTIEGSGSGPIVNITASNVLITGFTVRNSSYYYPNEYGIIAEQTADCRITNNLLEYCGKGVGVMQCDNFSITGNGVANCYTYCILLINSVNSRVEDNRLYNFSNYGITLTGGSDNVVKTNRIESDSLWCMSIDSADNTIYGNELIGCYGGMLVGAYQPSATGNNAIFHNSFVTISYPASEDSSIASPNVWDLGWPIGGNYWSEHDNTDVQSGPNQLGPGSDAIADTAYALSPSGAFDNVPCAGPISYVEYDYGGVREVPLISNSTISDFHFAPSTGRITFTATGDTGIGFCRITLPNDITIGLWMNSYKVLVDGASIDFGNWTHAGQTYIYFRYAHSTRRITIAPEGDESFHTVVYTTISDGSGVGDAAVEVAMDVDTTYSGSLNVTVLGTLRFPNGTDAAANSTSWVITDGDTEWRNLTLSIPPGAPVGDYTVELLLYDDTALEDSWLESIYLVGSVATLQIAVMGNGTTEPEPGWYHYPRIGVTVVEAFPDLGWLLDHWLLDGGNLGPDNPLPVELDGDHNLTAVFGAIPPESRELSLAIVGSGATDPPAGNHFYPLGAVVHVTAFPTEGWVLDHWALDAEALGPDNPLPLLMDVDHTLTAVFVEAPPPAAIESCNAVGERQDTFDLGEAVHVVGTGFAPSTDYELYIVEDVVNWVDGMAIPQRMAGTTTLVSSNASGSILPAAVWVNPQTLGHFDIVIDVNDNALYDEGIDILDDNDVEVTAGFIIPEFSMLLILPLFGFAILFTAALWKKHARK